MFLILSSSTILVEFVSRYRIEYSWYSIDEVVGKFDIHSHIPSYLITQVHKKSGMNFTCEYTTPMDFEPLNPNPVSEFPLDPPVFP